MGGKAKDETGNKHGRWTVIRQASRSKTGGAYWHCRCDCGTEKIVKGTSMRNGTSKSCGCLARELASKHTLINMVGKRYGRWTVISRAKNTESRGSRWLCQCDCGTKRVLGGWGLRSGHTKSCGCLSRELTTKRQLIDLTDRRYGRWTVISQTKNVEQGGPRWTCLCDCGTERAVLGQTLRDGSSKSCGCLAHELSHNRRLPEGVAAFNILLRGIKEGARDRGYKWALTRKQVGILTKQNCHYCGAEPRQVKRSPSGDCYTYNGIDRERNELGYIPENCVPCCCGVCNKMKGTMSTEMLAHVSIWKRS